MYIPITGRLIADYQRPSEPYIMCFHVTEPPSSSVIEIGNKEYVGSRTVDRLYGRLTPGEEYVTIKGNDPLFTKLLSIYTVKWVEVNMIRPNDFEVVVVRHFHGNWDELRPKVIGIIIDCLGWTLGQAKIVPYGLFLEHVTDPQGIPRSAKIGSRASDNHRRRYLNFRPPDH
jgi:hypothetical protein